MERGNLIDEKIPHILIDRKLTDNKIPSVSVDNFGGARMAAKHLITQGLRDIAMVSLNNTDISTTSERINGFMSALKDHGIKIPSSRIIQGNNLTIKENIRNTLQEYYQQNNLPEAIFAMDNNLAFICLEYLQKLSVEIPSETALIGFDDLQYFRYTRPSISAIEQPVEKIAETAFEMLWEQMSDKNNIGKQDSLVLPVDINIRNSSVKLSG